MRAGLSNFAELRAQVCARGGVGENISGTVCKALQEGYLTETDLPAGKGRGISSVSERLLTEFFIADLSMKKGH